MAKHFLVLSGSDKGLVVELSDSTSLPVGRGRQAQFRLTDPHVSRLHCLVDVTEDGIVIRDAGSLGGTHVNGRRVSEHVLQPGDVVTLGSTRIRYQEEDLADQPTLPPDALPAVPQAAQAPPTSPSRPATPAPAAADPAGASVVDVPIVSREQAATAPRSESPVPTPAPEPPAPQRRSAPDRLPTLPAERMGELTGHVISHYRIGPLLARGQSGLVFRARDSKNNRDVAIKVLRPEFSENKEGVERFVRAMKTMLPLRHPNLVALYGAGKTGPYCWVAMEYVDGESLAQVLHRIGVAGMLDWRFTLRISVDLARALQYAHEHQIIHRNITPQNTLLRASDRRALLGDLMLAKAMEGVLSKNVTRAGEVLGDIRYMSPERLSGTQAVDARSDIYSLGALIYALLCGHAPFEGETTVDTIGMIFKSELTRPKKFQMSIATAFEGVVMTMLNKYPEKRYQTVEKIVLDLETVAKFQNVQI